jgi:cathepsin D
VTLPSSSPVAIDTGTTLVGGPSEQIGELYAQIPGSAVGTGNYEGYYTYRTHSLYLQLITRADFSLACSTTVNVALSFGGQSWSISPDDFKLTKLSNGQCLGAFFVLSDQQQSSGNNEISWIIGDTFLKNVYSVFRANPASVGFATLASNAQSQVNAAGLPTPTIGSVSTSITGSGQTNSNAALPGALPYFFASLICAMSTSLLFML